METYEVCLLEDEYNIPDLILLTIGFCMLTFCNIGILYIPYIDCPHLDFQNEPCNRCKKNKIQLYFNILIHTLYKILWVYIGYELIKYIYGYYTAMYYEV
jgi:hypothetical protein